MQLDDYAHYVWYIGLGERQASILTDNILRSYKMDSQRYSDVIMIAMASQIFGALMFCLTVCSGADQRKHQSSESLVFVRGIHRWPMNSCWYNALATPKYGRYLLQHLMNATISMISDYYTQSEWHPSVSIKILLLSQWISRTKAPLLSPCTVTYPTLLTYLSITIYASYKRKFTCFKIQLLYPQIYFLSRVTFIMCKFNDCRNVVYMEGVLLYSSGNKITTATNHC